MIIPQPRIALPGEGRKSGVHGKSGIGKSSTCATQTIGQNAKKSINSTVI